MSAPSKDELKTAVIHAAIVWRSALARVPRPSDADVALATAIDKLLEADALSHSASTAGGGE